MILRTNVAEQRTSVCMRQRCRPMSRAHRHVQAFFRFTAGELAGMQHGSGVACGLPWCRHSTSIRVFLQAELLDERIGENAGCW